MCMRLLFRCLPVCLIVSDVSLTINRKWLINTLYYSLFNTSVDRFEEGFMGL